MMRYKPTKVEVFLKVKHTSLFYKTFLVVLDRSMIQTLDAPLQTFQALQEIW